MLASILITSIVFITIILTALFQYSNNVATAAKYTQETQPARVAIEHLLTTIYDDFLLVEEYLLITEYSSLSQYDDRLSHSQEQCEALTDEVDDLITLEKLTNQDAITSYKTALLIYSSWERSRDSLLKLHKESLATNKVSADEFAKEKERFIHLMQNATTLFTASLEELNTQNVQLQKDLETKTKTVKTLLILLFITTLLISIVGSYLLIKLVAKPLDEMSKASSDFTKGNYKTRIKESSKLTELLSLQKQLNRVYSLIDSTFKTKEQKQKASQHLLPSKYKDILDFIHDMSQQGRVPTIKDIKKNLSLTHPTAISRLKYLQQNGYIEIKKHGRNKCIFEIS